MHTSQAPSTMASGTRNHEPRRNLTVCPNRTGQAMLTTIVPSSRNGCSQKPLLAKHGMASRQAIGARRSSSNSVIRSSLWEKSSQGGGYPSGEWRSRLHDTNLDDTASIASTVSASILNRIAVACPEPRSHRHTEIVTWRGESS